MLLSPTCLLNPANILEILQKAVMRSHNKKLLSKVSNGKFSDANNDFNVTNVRN